jgi:hypothetical protein
MTTTITPVSVRDDYAPRFGRQVLSLWGGGFASDYGGQAWELPAHDGFMVSLDYGSARVRVTCPAPRTDENYQAVDAAIGEAYAALASRGWEIQADYGQGWEVECVEGNREDARTQLATYRANVPGTPYRVRRETVPGPVTR